MASAACIAASIAAVLTVAKSCWLARACRRADNGAGALPGPGPGQERLSGHPLRSPRLRDGRRVEYLVASTTAGAAGGRGRGSPQSAGPVLLQLHSDDDQPLCCRFPETRLVAAPARAQSPDLISKVLGPPHGPWHAHSVAKIGARMRRDARGPPESLGRSLPGRPRWS